MSPELENNTHALVWLQKTVPGFRGAYLEDAQFKAVIDNQLRLMRIQTELMVLGSESRRVEYLAEIKRAEREPFTSSVHPSPSRPLTIEDLEHGRDNAGPRFIP